MAVIIVLMIATVGSVTAARSHVDTFLTLSSRCIESNDCSSCLTQKDWGCHWCPRSQICLSLMAGCPQDDEASLFADHQCRCGDVTGGTCSSCVSNPGCIYARQGTITYRMFGESYQKEFHSNRTGPGGLCLEGGPFKNGHKYYVVSDSLGVYVDVYPESWCWGQCSITGAWFISLIIIAILLLSAVIVCWAISRRSRSGFDYRMLR